MLSNSAGSSPTAKPLFGNQFLVSEPVRGTSGEFITLARVVKTQGRRGEVAAEIHTGVPDRFSAGMPVLALPPMQSAPPEAVRRELEVEEVWPHKGLLVLKFLGVDSISEAESLIGHELQVQRSERAGLDPGWNYVSDLAGCTVLDHGVEIGRIADVQFGAGEAPLLIVKNSGGQQFDIPFAEAYLDGMDLGLRQVRMNLPAGMLEINAPVTDEEKVEQVRPAKKKGH
jgi:16S rRNA processing protein RimM